MLKHFPRRSLAVAEPVVGIVEGFGSNAFIADLPAAELERWRPMIEPVRMVAGQVLCSAVQPLDHVYFPTTAIVSFLQLLQSGHSAEVAVVGCDGFIGAQQLTSGENVSAGMTTVRCGGYALRVPMARMRQEFCRSEHVRALVLHCISSLMTQTSQIAICNRYHSIEQQLCRWLLMTLDRLEGDSLQMTHEVMAEMLGVRRESISEIAARLQQDGVIFYRRGHLLIRDRERLRRRACECYDVIHGAQRTGPARPKAAAFGRSLFPVPAAAEPLGQLGLTAA